MSQTIDIPTSIAAALQHHQAGRLAAAETIYRQILSVHPNEPEAMHLLGVLLHQAGHSARGADLIAQSVSLHPTFASLCNLGEVFRTIGRHNDAIACLRRSLDLNPKWPDTHGNLGIALMDMKQLDQAEQCFKRAIELAPQRADMHLRLARVKSRQLDPHAAAIAARRAVELQPTSAEAWTVLAMALSESKKHIEALEAGRRALELAPQAPDAHVRYGLVLAASGDSAGAEVAYRKAISLNPQHAPAYHNLAALLDRADRVDEAIAAATRALELEPNDVVVWTNLSSLYRRTSNYRAAVEAAEQALRVQPGLAAAHGSLGLALLALGDYERGFAEYEWRWRCDNFTTAARDLERPAWSGSDPSGRTIYVHTEQGYGDIIQFVRYIPMLAARGAAVLLDAPVPLRGLMQSVRGVSKVLVSGMRPPEHDLQIPLLSLPKLFKTTLATVPGEVPYLAAPPEKVAAWKQRLESLGGGLKVGLVWAGNVKPDPYRTCPLSEFAPLADVPGVTFISLQKRDNPRASDSPPAGMAFVDVAEHLKDFLDTAAAMTNLDLIITIDTASAHLAGALGRPTWTLLPFVADWRWLEAREDSPWYPSMRLFRQPAKADWPGVMQRVRAELVKLASAQRSASRRSGG